MEELLSELKAAAQGQTPEQIAAQIQASQHADLITDPDQLARFVSAVATADNPAAATPEPATPVENAGND